MCGDRYGKLIIDAYGLYIIIRYNYNDDVMHAVNTCDVFTMLKISLVMIYVNDSLDVSDALLVSVDILSPGIGRYTCWNTILLGLLAAKFL